MNETLQINFAVGSIADVQRALETVQRSFVRFDQGATRQVKAGARERTTTVDKEAKDRSRIEARAARDAERQAIMVSRKLAQEEKARTRSAEREGRSRAMITQRAEREATRAVEKEARERQRVVDREERAKAKIVSDAYKTVRRERIRDDERAARAGTRFREGVGGRAAGMVGNAVSTVGRLGAAAVGVGGGFAVADAVGRDIKLRGKASELSINSGGEVGADRAYQMATSGGVTYGKDASEVMEGMDRFVAKSGDVKMATEVMGDLLQLSNATGAAFNELAEVAGQFFAADKTMNAKELADQMRDIAAQGRAASVDMRELAQYGARLSGGAAEFSMGGAKNRSGIVRQLGGLAQLAAAKGGATSAAEATESVLSLGLDVNEHADKFDDLGIKTKGGDGMLLSPQDIIKGSVAKTKGNKTELMELFGRRSYRAVAGYGNTYLDAKKELGAKGMSGQALEDASLKRADAVLAQYANVTITREQVSKENAQRMANADKQLESAMQDLRNAVGRELVPELVKMVPAVKDLVPTFGDAMRNVGRFVKFFGENPWQGIGLIIAGSIAKDIAAAGLGAAVKQAVIAAMGGSGASAAGGAAASSFRGLATAGAAGAAAWSIGSAISGTIEAGGAYDASGASAASGAGTLEVYARRAKAGTLTPEQAKRGQEIAARLSSSVSMAEARNVGGSAGAAVLGAASNITGGAFGLGEASAKRSADQAILDQKAVIEAAAKTFADALIQQAQKSGQTAGVDPASRSAPMTDSRRGGASK